MEKQQPKSPGNADKRVNQLAKQVAEMSREERLEAVKKQVEYYFSPENLRNDPYLTSQMDAQRTVPMSVIVKFPKLKTLMGGDADMLQEAIAASSSIKLTEAGDRIKASLLGKGGSAGTNRNTIIIRDVASDATEVEIREIFNFDDCKDKVESVRSDVGNCWFVEMKSESAAKDTLLQLKLKGRKLRGEGVKARLKTDSVVRSYFSQPTKTSPTAAQSVGMGMMGNPAGLGPGGMPLGMNFMPYGQFPQGGYGLPPQGMAGMPPGSFPPGAAMPGFAQPVNMGPGGMPMGMMPTGGPGGMPARGMYGGDDAAAAASGGPSPKNAGGRGDRGGGVGDAGSGGAGSSEGSADRGGGAKRGGGSAHDDSRSSQGRGTGGASGGGARGTKMGKGGANASNYREGGGSGTGKGGKKSKDGSEGGKQRGYVVDVSSFPQLGSLPVDDSPVPTPGYKGEYKKYSHDEIVTIVSHIKEVTAPVDSEGKPLDPSVHAHAMSNSANMDLLKRQRSFSMEEYREQLKQGVPIPKEILIAGDTSTSSVARATSIAFGEAEAPASRQGIPLVAVSAPASVTATATVTAAAATTSAGSVDVAKEAAVAAIDQSIDTAAAYLEAKATVGGPGIPQAAAVVPTLSTWAALAAKAAATQTDPTEPTNKRSVGVGTAVSPSAATTGAASGGSAGKDSSSVSSGGADSGKGKGRSGGGRGRERKVS